MRLLLDLVLLLAILGALLFLAGLGNPPRDTDLQLLGGLIGLVGIGIKWAMTASRIPEVAREICEEEIS